MPASAPLDFRSCVRARACPAAQDASRWPRCVASNRIPEHDPLLGRDGAEINLVLGGRLLWQ